jgi:hypothetical protein
MYDTAIRSLIRSRYAAAHDALPAADYPAYLSIGAPDAPHAVLGFRTAGDEALFLERYLDRPVEVLLGERMGRPVPRTRVVEIGDHASQRSTATIALWREAAAALVGQADVAVAVLTAPLRAMFARLALPLIVLAPAPIEAVGDAARAWGRYYDSDPMVCAGEIAACRRALVTSPVEGRA